MSEHDQAAPAGDGLVTATLQQPMTLDAVAGMLAMDDDDDAPASPEPSTSPTPDTASADRTDPAGEGDPDAAAADADEETPGEGEPQAEDPDAAQTEPEGYDWEKVPGDAKFRLRDGTVVTGAEIKQRWDDLQQASRQKEYLAQEYAKFQQQQAHLATQAQQFFPVAQQAIQAIQASLPQIPPVPDPALATTDPIRYVEERARYDAAVNEYQTKAGQMRAIQAQAEAQTAKLRDEQQQRLASYIDDQRAKLFEAVPDLRDEGKRREFHRDFVDAGKAYGFSEQELSSVYDHRTIRMARDAIAYRKLMAKPRPQPGAPAQGTTAQAPAAPRAPVAQPGRRASPQEGVATQRKALMDQARAKGGIDLREAASLLMLDD